MAPVPADLDVSQPSTDEIAATAALASSLDQLARGVESSSAQFGELATGETLDEVRAAMAELRTSVDTAASAAAAAAQALGDMRAAGDAWLRDAPKAADFEAAIAAVDAARAAMQAAANADEPTAAFVEQLRIAQQRLRELEARREAADEAYENACRRAKEKLRKCMPPAHRDSRTPEGLPGATGGLESGERTAEESGAGTAEAPGAGSAPGAGAAAGAPAAAATPGAAPPVTRPSTATGSSTGAGSSSDLSPDMLKLLANQPQPAAAQPQMAAPQPQPQLAAQSGAPAPASQAQNRRADGALGLEDLGLGGTAAAAVPLGLASGSSTPPVTPPATATAPAPVPPPPSPTPGTSVNGLSTAADVTGRSETPRGPYSPATTTSHATGTAAPAATPLAGRGMGTGMGMGHMPMVPMAGMAGAGGGGGGGGSSRSDGDDGKVTSYKDGLNHGADELAAAVPGGTIAQRRDRD